MTTMAQLVDRAYREYLSLPDDNPAFGTLNGAIDAAVTSLVFNDFAIPEEEALVAAGTIIESGSELMRVTAYDDNTNTATVVRGVNGTTAASHANGAVVFLAPAYPRQTVFDSLADAIEDLYPRLWAIGSERIWTDDVVELPASATEYVSCRALIDGEWQEVHPEVVSNFGESATGVAAMFPVEERGFEARISYRMQFTRPTSESDDLQVDLGVASRWEDLVLLGAVGSMLAGRELDQSTVEYLTEALEAQSVPIGQRTNVATAMLRARESKLRESARELRGRHRPPVRMKKAAPWQ